MALIEEAHKAARILLDHAYVRIMARTDPDAACAAVLLAHALRRESVDFHVSWARRLDEQVIRAVAEERPDCLVLIGLGGDHAGDVQAGRTIAIDTADRSPTADARVHDDAGLASLAHLVAAGISRRNVDLAPLALAGALAAMRDIGAWRGLDAEILKEAIETGVVTREAALAIGTQPLLQALAQLDAPYIVGLTGRARNAKKAVSDLRLNGDAPASALAPDEAERLGDLLTLRLLQQGAPDAALDALFRPTLRALAGPFMGIAVGELARIAEAACAAERPGLAFAALWADAAAGGEVLDVAIATREAIVQALVAAERETKREGAFLVVEAPSAALCRPLADRIALAHAREGTTVAVHAGGFVALRAWGATPRRADLWTDDVTRSLKELDGGAPTLEVHA